MDELAAETAISFGSFRLLPQQRMLLENGKPVRLGSRALDILIALALRPGQVLSNKELMDLVWPSTVVSEGNLAVNMVGLRRTLGDGSGGKRFIVNLPGRGYSFVAPVVPENPPSDRVPATTAVPTRHNLPIRLTPLIGREDAVEAINSLQKAHRLVTITGPGGIGKTSLALAAAERLLEAFPDGVWLVDLSLLVDRALVPDALGAILGVEVKREDPYTAVLRALEDKKLLLLFDNCAHVIDAAASLVLRILKTAPAVNILATSRERLRIMGERVYRLPPLSMPGESTVTADEALRFSAVRLFFERTAADWSGYELTDDDAPFVVEICRKLDGIPLAIELATARVQMLGVRGLAARLQERLHLLSAGFRTSPPRHRTLSAAVDWSHDLLRPEERRMFRRLAVFAGGFTLQAAAAVVADPGESEAEAIRILAELVEKSLVVVYSHETESRLRLLDTTRDYALQKLAESGELRSAAHSHAEYYTALFEQADAELETKPIAAWLTEYNWQIDNLRAALDWAFSPEGDPSIGLALTAAAIPLWMQSSLVEEARRRVEQAFAAVAAGAEVDARREMKLSAALGAALIYTRNGGTEVAEAWNRTLKIAEEIDDADYQLLSVWGLWAFHVNGVQYETALRLARRFSSLAATRRSQNDRQAGERMIAISYHFLGHQSNARRHIDRALRPSAAPDDKRQIIRFELDAVVTARVHLARILWMQGFPDRARREAEQSLEDARTARHAISFNYALHRGVCPVMLWAGDLSAAARYASMLLDHAKRHGLQGWQLYGRGYAAVVDIKRGDLAAGLGILRTCFEELGGSEVSVPRFMRFAAVHAAEALGQAGSVSDGLLAIDDAIERAERTKELWDLPELMRVRGELLLLQSESRDPAAAEEWFRRALDVAQRQGALSWELRAGTSLARLMHDQHRRSEGTALLRSIYERFTEGFHTADLKAAEYLLDELTGDAPAASLASQRRRGQCRPGQGCDEHPSG